MAVTYQANSVELTNLQKSKFVSNSNEINDTNTTRAYFLKALKLSACVFCLPLNIQHSAPAFVAGFVATMLAMETLHHFQVTTLMGGLLCGATSLLFIYTGLLSNYEFFDNISKNNHKITSTFKT